MNAIEVNHLTKEYRLGALTGLKQVVRNVGARLIGSGASRAAPFKALDDVSFSIAAGEVVGIIGHNGAGKSTLLKMLARISTPTQGSVHVNGRVAPLIEVGAGFVGEFTGRENVYLNGAILGLSKKEILRKFDEIVDFAEMAPFIDTPVKRYSSGMQVKLAFAVATSIESEILIVDEVLAVGDLAFQRKCFSRMEEIIKRERRTVLLVSHNIRQVERLCSRVIMMDHGRKSMDGESRTVCNAFYSQSDRKVASNEAKSSAGYRGAQRSGEIDLEKVELLDSQGNVTDHAVHDEECTLELTYVAHTELSDVIFGVGIHTTDFVYLADRDTEDDARIVATIAAGRFTIRCCIKRFPLLPGTYSFRLGVATGPVYHMAFYLENVLPFTVVGRHKLRLQSCVPLNVEWNLDDCEKPAASTCVA